ncbi:MAG: efflux RND transporter periplasmic adaptor subunit [Bacteroidales bacterium]|nr:efflux RND transporter periplasmic adaptor subunit [Candidatus Cacconaster equi]
MKTRICHLSVIALALLSVASCKRAPEVKHTSFETVTLTKESIEVPIRWSATIVGKNDVVITPQISGQLMEVCVVTGEKVSKGQKLFVIDKRQPELALNQAKADLAAYQAAESSAQLEYESTKNLYDKGIVSIYSLNTAQNVHERAKAVVNQAKAAVANAALNLDFCTIKAPVSGMIGSLPLNAGVMVSPLTELTTISGNSEMTAKFSLTEIQVKETVEEFGSLNEALKKMPLVSLFLKDGSEYPHKGKIESISGVVDQMTGSVECRATFANPDGVLYSGMQGKVEMPLKFDEAMVIPLTAIVRLQDKTIVQKVKDNCAQTTVVVIEELGNGKDATVLEGLEEGDVIVAKGAANIYDGQQVIFPEEKSENK